MDKIWKYIDTPEASINSLHDSLKINKNLCKILIDRGYDTFDKAKSFFRPTPEDLHNPFLMQDMDVAVRTILNALLNNQNICIFGDYDVDGTTSVSSLYHYLKNHFPQYQGEIYYYIPNRYTEGYGLSNVGIDYASNNKCSLLVILDCGIKSHDKIDYANVLGIQTIICDHHLPAPTLPLATAIINPKRVDCAYPFKELSACGIVFKLIQAINEYADGDLDMIQSVYAEWATLSIASDIVSLIGENRIIAYFGIQRINSPFISTPIRILKEISKSNGPLTISKLVFNIGPKINAAGRIDMASKVVDFFTETNPIIARQKASILKTDNDERIKLDKSITDDVFKLLLEDEQINKNSTVLYAPHWSKGVVGIVASRAIDKAYKPTIILTKSNGLITGSARSVIGFDIHYAIQSCADLLETYGGHMFAAGLTLKEENLEAFKTRFEEIVIQTIQPESLQPTLFINASITFDEITANFVKILDQFEPCGPDNLHPIFVTTYVNDTGNSKILKDKHLQLFITNNGRIFKGIAFNMADKYDIVKSGKPFQIAYHIEKNYWNGLESIDLRILDIKSL